MPKHPAGVVLTHLHCIEACGNSNPATIETANGTRPVPEKRYIRYRMKTLKTILILILAASSTMDLSAQALRVGVAGLVHDHVRGLLARAQKGDIDIVGIAESNTAVAKAYSAEYGFPMSKVYPTLEAMIEKTKPEAVMAFNSIYDHLSTVEYCAPRGIHVMVEKPLAVSVAHAEKMIALAKQYHIYLLTNYETTWYGSNREAYRLVNETSTTGPLRKIVFYTGHQGPKEIGCSPQFLEWLTDPVKNGAGALTDFGCYGANLATWLMNNAPPESVTAVASHIKPDVYPKVEDEATIILKYPKTQVIIQASWNWPYGRKEMEVYGRDGAVICKNGTDMQVTDHQKLKPVSAAPMPEGRRDPFEYFANVVRGKIELKPGDLSSMENNEIVVKILEAARESVRTGRAMAWRH
jgi:predicted dehydrogenase